MQRVCLGMCLFVVLLESGLLCVAFSWIASYSIQAYCSRPAANASPLIFLSPLSPLVTLAVNKGLHVCKLDAF
jgi:hypothetical protein